MHIVAQIAINKSSAYDAIQALAAIFDKYPAITAFDITTVEDEPDIIPDEPAPTWEYNNYPGHPV